MDRPDAAAVPTELARFAADVARGLTDHPRRLPCKYLYDETGSALFERICDTPEYYITRVETEILATTVDELTAALPHPVQVFELGSGSATKTELLLAALLRRQRPLRYVPIDVSRAALVDSAARLTARHHGLVVEPTLAEYEDAPLLLGPSEAGSKLVVWLGSSIGNLDRAAAAEMLRRLATACGDSGRLLVGVDLRKPVEQLIPAYDDAEGVTAAFNKNLLARINRELGGRFALDGFAHRASYDADEGRVDMHLVSRSAQLVHIQALGMEISVAAGELIHTESSYKYSEPEVSRLAAAAGLRVQRWCPDGRCRFAVVLLGP